MGNKLGAFILGAGVGAAIALLVAPRPGVETRAIVADRLNTAWNGAQDFGTKAAAQTQQVYQTATARGQEFAQAAAARGQEFAQAAGVRVQQAAGAVRDAAGAAASAVDSDELREKIEAARQRIASQVMRNAEQSRDAANDTIDVTEDAAVEDVVAAESADEAAK